MSLESPALTCDACRTALPEAVFNAPVPVACPGCHAQLEARVFPAFRRPPAAARPAEALASDEDAGCFYHPLKKAVVPCARCGRFLCALCDLEIAGQHLCPGCASAPRAPGDAAAASLLLTRPKVFHDRIALSLATLPLVFFFFWFATFLTAPAALFLVVRYWGEVRRGPLPRSHFTGGLAGLIALAEITGWAILLTAGGGTFWHAFSEAFQRASHR